MAPRTTLAAVVVLLAGGPARADDPRDNAAIKRAITGGQTFLRAMYQHGPPGPGRLGPGGGGVIPPPAMLLDPVAGGPMGAGSAWLTGLALVESGAPANDPIVAGLARLARENVLNTTGTYQVSLLIMFLDRIGAPGDEPLIQFLTLRLLTGQCPDGSWSYQCGGLNLDPVEQRRLFAELTRGAKLATPDTPKPEKKGPRPRTDLDNPPAPPTKDKPPPKPGEPEKPKGLHPALRNYERALKEQPRGAGSGYGFGQIASGDHSNTQFATVALWCGRRHHVKVGDALALLDKHYRQCQKADGGWSYTADGTSSPAMTCAGLIGLAMGFGSKGLKDGTDKSARVDADAISKDPIVQAGLKYVGDFVAAAAGHRDPRQPGGFLNNDLSQNLYFMWSLERVGMAFGLTTIGKVDWYDWGSKVLVRAQNQDGSWSSNDGHSSADNATAFALLFLCRANLAEDLATSMKGKVRDPGTSRLRSPGDLSEMLGKTGKGSPGGRTDPGTTRPRNDRPPAPGPTDEVERLAAALVAAADADRAKILEDYRDSKGAQYTDALARAIPRLRPEDQAAARDALARRSTRFTTGTLNGMMRDRDRELRRAAALASAAKGKDRLGEFADSLVRLAADEDELVAQAARASLKALTGQDFGPDVNARPADRTRAFLAWREWLARQKP